MKTLALVATALLTSAAQTIVAANSNTSSQAVASPLTAVRDILHAQPFTLAKPYRNDWSKDHALVTSGLLLVLQVDPALVAPRNAAEPILYAGNRAVQRLNHGDQSGRVIGIVPGIASL